MRLSSFIVATAATAVVAQNIDETFVIDQSDSFHLIHARHKPFNKKLLGACHDGTAFETLCMSDITSKPPNDMNYRTSSSFLSPVFLAFDERNIDGDV